MKNYINKSIFTNEFLFKKLVEFLEERKKVALITIVDKQGSAPRDVGTKMLVTEDGEVVGTIGGGKFEKMLIDEALKCINEDKSKIIRFSFTGKEVEKAIDTGLICGGILTVFVDVIKPQERVILFGVGKVGKPLAYILNFMGFKVIVTDPNPDLVSKDVYPFAEDLISGKPEEITKKLMNRITKKDILLVTHGDISIDYMAVKSFLGKTMFVGLLGSKRKIAEFVRKLKSEGVNVELIKKYLRGPIGLDIGAQTPEEIAISVAAEILAFLRKAKPKSLNIVPQL